MNSRAIEVCDNAPKITSAIEGGMSGAASEDMLISAAA